MKNADIPLLLLGGGIVLAVGWFALRPRSASAQLGEPPRGAVGGSGVGLNIGGMKGFTLKVPESVANKAFSAAAVAF